MQLKTYVLVSIYFIGRNLGRQMLGICANSWQSNACGWSLFDLWHAMDWLSRADVLFLAIMLVDTAVIVCQRFYDYSTAAKQSREFVRDASTGLRDSKFDEVISLASRSAQSHVAAIVGAGLGALSQHHQSSLIATLSRSVKEPCTELPKLSYRI